MLHGLSNALTKEFGKGFSVTNIQQMRNFYLVYENNRHCLLNLKKSRQRLLYSIYLVALLDTNTPRKKQLQQFIENKEN
ncbi:DUF1016 family protein [Lacihabitans soyangensis]|uniref:DUF1016 family protein n=1 Tax=Lacihabitans soyangensis TaxID=869394 RepID=A0AAE3H7V8_9BACT|nr:DUF1016 family protein [Lacihabitans soyangensis]